MTVKALLNSVYNNLIHGIGIWQRFYTIYPCYFIPFISVYRLISVIFNMFTLNLMEGSTRGQEHVVVKLN